MKSREILPIEDRINIIFVDKNQKSSDLDLLDKYHRALEAAEEELVSIIKIYNHKLRTYELMLIDNKKDADERYNKALELLPSLQYYIDMEISNEYNLENIKQALKIAAYGTE